MYINFIEIYMANPPNAICWISGSFRWFSSLHYSQASVVRRQDLEYCKLWVQGASTIDPDKLVASWEYPCFMAHNTTQREIMEGYNIGEYVTLNQLEDKTLVKELHVNMKWNNWLVQHWWMAFYLSLQISPKHANHIT